VFSIQFRHWLAPLAVMAALVAPREARAQRQITVNIESVPAGATVRLDSESAQPLGSTPLQRVRIPAGAHTLFFTREGFVPGRIDVNVRRRNETFTATLTQAGSVFVSADVDGAQVFLDGNAVGTTPGRINNVPPGQHVVEVRQTGMQPYRETVNVGAGALVTVNANLRPPPPQAPSTGTVRVIVSNPAGPLPQDLQVLFDGAPLSGTPPTIENAQPGQHIVQVSASGFRTVRRPVDVQAGQAMVLAVDLEPAQVVPTGGTVRVLTNTPGAQVELDGEVLTGTPPQRTNVSPGRHVVRVTAAGRQPYVNNEVTVTAGQDTVLNVPDLAVVPQVGRLAVSTPTPDAHVLIDGRDVGSAPYSREDMPYGQYNITVRAPGFDERTETCRVSATEQCVLNLPLTRTAARASVRVELARPLEGAVVLMDGQELGEIGAGREVPNLLAGPEHPHEIRVQAEGYQDYVENFTLSPNETRRIAVTLRRYRRGPTGAELAQRRSAISTFGASPLSRGDAALDLFFTYGAFPLTARGTIGLLQYGPVGFDFGGGVRSMGWWWEVEFRARAAVRLADGLFSLGGELRPFGGLGTAGGGNVGIGGWVTASIHSLALQSEQDAENIEDPNERANRFGSFAISLRLGFEYYSDTLKNLTQSPGIFGANRRFDPALCSFMGQSGVVGAPDATRMGMPYTTGCPSRTEMDGNRVITDGGQSLIRPLIGLTFEFGLGRHWNVFISADRVLGDAATINRALYQAFWGGNDSLTYVSLGFTYKL
jgi:hypothetical protein